MPVCMYVCMYVCIYEWDFSYVVTLIWRKPSWWGGSVLHILYLYCIYVCGYIGGMAISLCIYVCMYVFMYVNITVTMTYVCTHAKRTFKKIANYKTSYAYIYNTGFLWSNLTKNYQVLYTYRHPLDVALSMHKREFEQFKVRRGLKLWYKHFRFHAF